MEKKKKEQQGTLYIIQLSQIYKVLTTRTVAETAITDLSLESALRDHLAKHSNELRPGPVFHTKARVTCPLTGNYYEVFIVDTGAEERLGRIKMFNTTGAIQQSDGSKVASHSVVSCIQLLSRMEEPPTEYQASLPPAEAVAMMSGMNRLCRTMEIGRLGKRVAPNIIEPILEIYR